MSVSASIPASLSQVSNLPNCSSASRRARVLTSAPTPCACCDLSRLREPDEGDSRLALGKHIFGGYVHRAHQLVAVCLAFGGPFAEPAMISSWSGYGRQNSG